MTDRAILEMSCNHWFQVHSFSSTHSARHVSAPCVKFKFHKTSLQSSCGGKHRLDDVQMGCQSTVMLPAYKGYFCEPHVLMLSTYNCLLKRGGLQSESRLSSEVQKTVNCNCWSSVAASRWCNNDPTLWSIQQSCKFLQVHKTSGIVGFTGSVWHHRHRIPWEHYWRLSPEWFKGPTSLEGSLTSWPELGQLVMVFFCVSLFCLWLLCCGSARLGSMFCPSTWDQFADKCPVWCCSDTTAVSVCTLRFPFFLEASTFLRSNLWRMQSVQQQSLILNIYPLKVTLRLVLFSESTSVLQTLSSIAFGTHANLFPIVR